MVLRAPRRRSWTEQARRPTLFVEVLRLYLIICACHSHNLSGLDVYTRRSMSRSALALPVIRMMILVGEPQYHKVEVYAYVLSAFFKSTSSRPHLSSATVGVIPGLCRQYLNPLPAGADESH